MELMEEDATLNQKLASVLDTIPITYAFFYVIKKYYNFHKFSMINFKIQVGCPVKTAKEFFELVIAQFSTDISPKHLAFAKFVVKELDLVEKGSKLIGKQDLITAAI